jgi:hypothetical protein
MIEDAGLEEGAIFLLWAFAGGHAHQEIAQMYLRAEEANRRMNAAIRAEEVAQTRTPKRASSSSLFRERASESIHDALKAEWPMPSANVHSVGDELALASKVKGREIPLDAVRQAMVKAVGERSPVGPFYFLFLLQGYAAEHGITLGNKRLVALAECADPHRSLDEGTVGRYLREIPESVRDGIRRDALPTLPSPAPRNKKR